jgi:hypothetical protein
MHTTGAGTHTQPDTETNHLSGKNQQADAIMKQEIFSSSGK